MTEGGGGRERREGGAERNWGERGKMRGVAKGGKVWKTGEVERGKAKRSTTASRSGGRGGRGGRCGGQKGDPHMKTIPLTRGNREAQGGKKKNSSLSPVGDKWVLYGKIGKKTSREGKPEKRKFNKRLPGKPTHCAKLS